MAVLLTGRDLGGGEDCPVYVLPTPNKYTFKLDCLFIKINSRMRAFQMIFSLGVS